MDDFFSAGAGVEDAEVGVEKAFDDMGLSASVFSGAFRISSAILLASAEGLFACATGFTDSPDLAPKDPKEKGELALLSGTVGTKPPPDGAGDGVAVLDELGLRRENDPTLGAAGG